MSTRIKATAEVLLVWVLVVLGVDAIAGSPLGRWDDHEWGLYAFEYLLVLLLPLLRLLVTRRSLADYGFSFSGAHDQRRVLVTGTPFMLLVAAALYVLGWRQWLSALALFLLAGSLCSSTG